MAKFEMRGRPQTAPRQSWDKTIVAHNMANKWPYCPDGTICDATPASGRTYTRLTWPPRGRGRGESLTSPRRIAAKLRTAEVIRLRGDGHTWDHIARVTGFKDASGPYRAYKRAIDRAEWDRKRRAAMSRD
jgi:hypothetical protein